jgi:predicted MFS family arabinose efflux permease
MNRIGSAWIVWFFATIFYAYQYILRVLPNVAMPNIIADFEVGAAEIGLFSGVYYIGYAAMHIPLVLLMDRFSIKRVIPICVVLTSFGLIPLVYSESFYNAILGRFVIGAASSAAVLGIFKATKSGFGEKRFASMVGMSVTIGLLGGIYGGLPLDYIIQIYGWKEIINYFVVFGFILATLLYFMFPSELSNEKATDEVELVPSNMWSDIKIIFTNKRVLLLALAGGLMVGPLEGFADTWGTTFFESFYGLDRVYSSSLPSVIFLGMCFGSTLLGYITDKTRAHVKVVLVSNIFILIFFSLLFKRGFRTEVLSVLLFLIGMLSAYQMAIVSKVREYTNRRLADLTSAASNIIIMIFGTIFHFSIGLATSYFSSVEKGLSVIPLGLVLALLLLFVVMKIDLKRANEK